MDWDVVQKNMKIHHTIQIPKEFDRLDELKNYLAEKYSSDLHEFDFIESDTVRPKPHHSRLLIDWNVAIRNDDERGRKSLEGLTSSFGLRDCLLRFDPDQP